MHYLKNNKRRKSATKYIYLFLLFLVFSSSSKAQTWYTLKDDDVVIENGVIMSCSYDFSIKNIIIPSTLDGQTVKEISNHNGVGVFKNKGITGLQLPESVTFINKYAFADNSLTDIIIPISTAYIENYAFQNNLLTNVVLQSGLNFIGQGAFENNYIDSLFIPNSVTSVSFDAFENNSIRKLIFEDNSTLEKIMSDAFKDNSITNLNIPNSVTYIGFWAFENNQLSSVEIPDSITFMGGGAFNKNIISKINGKSSSGFIYARKDNGKEDSTVLVSYGGGTKNMDFIPENVSYISWSAFYNCMLDSVIIPKGIVKIGNSAFAYNPLKKVYFEENSNIRMIQEYSFHNNTDSTYFVLPTNSNHGFSGYKDQNDHYYNVGDTITEISNLCIADLDFYTLSIDDVNFEEGSINNYTGNVNGYSKIIIPGSFNGIPVTSIAENSFQTNSLDTVILPNSIEHIGSWAFYDNIFTTLSLPTPDLKEGYDSFIGWFDEDADTLVNTPVNNFLLSYIAKFNLTNYSINYINVGTLNSPNNPKTYTIDDEITLETPKDSTGHKFGGWFLDESYQDTISTPAIVTGTTGNINIYAKWLLNTGLDRKQNFKFNIYPNPASSYLNIEINTSYSINAVFELYNLNGSLLKRKQILHNNQIILLNSINKGEYIAKLMIDNKIYSKKIIIYK